MSSRIQGRAIATTAMALMFLAVEGPKALAQTGPLGLSNGYTEFIFSYSYQGGVDNLGAVAIGGAANFNNYTIDNGGHSPYALVVGGSLNGASGTITGNVVAGGSVSYTTPSITGSLSSAGSVVLGGGGTVGGKVTYGGTFSNSGTTVGGSGQGSVAVPINFSAEEAMLRGLSTAQYHANDPSLAPSYGTLNLSVQNGGTYFYNISAADFANIKYGINISAPSNATVVLNIAGTSDAFAGGGYNLSGGIGAGHVLYNFYQATSLALAAGVQGTVLAPWANVTFGSGNLNGQLIADSLGSASTYAQGEIHDYEFSGAGLRAVPEPSSLALLGLGTLGLVGYARRRRRAA